MPRRMTEEPDRKTSRRRRFAWFLGIIFLALVAAALGLAITWPNRDTFTVDGVPFRTWLAQRPDFSIEDPIANMGTNTVQHLVEILRLPGESSLTYKAHEVVWNLLPQKLQAWHPDWRPQPVWQLKRTAYFALRFLGPAARSALPDVIRWGRSETNRMVRSSALVAALSIAPESPDAVAFWKEDWQRTNYNSRDDLAIYLRMARYPIPAAAPLLLQEIRTNLSKPPVNELQAFEFMGEAARPAVPYMIQVMGTGGNMNSGNMVALFERLGPVAADAAPALGKVLNQQNPGMPGAALEALAAIGPPARPALADILPWTTNSDTELRMQAVFARAQIEQNAELAVPTLVAVLEKKIPSGRGSSYVPIQFRAGDMPGVVTGGAQAALLLLGRLGPGARSALPAVEARLGETNNFERLFAAQADWRIAQDATRSLPVLIETLNALSAPTPGQPSFTHQADDYLAVAAIEALEDMGPAAMPAIPALERVRPFSGRIRRAVDTALLKIKPQSP